MSLPDVKPGDSVYVDGRRAVFLGVQAGQAKVSVDGAHRFVGVHAVSLEPNGATLLPSRPGADPFEQLIDAARKVREGLEGDRDRAEARVATRRSQVRLLDRALSILTQAPAAPRPEGKKNRWSAEQREAASKRMRDRNAARKASGGV